MSRLRQVVLCVRDIDSATKKVCEELDTFVTFRDPSLKGTPLTSLFNSVSYLFEINFFVMIMI